MLRLSAFVLTFLLAMPVTLADETQKSDETNADEGDSAAASETKGETAAETKDEAKPQTDGGFGAPFMGVTTIKGDPGFISGGYGAWVINKEWALGGGGFGSSVDTTVGGFEEKVTMGFGGVLCEHYILPDERIHPTASLLVGWGSVQVGDDSSSIFALRPGIGAEMIATEWLRINLRGDYHWVMGSDIQPLTDSSLSSWSVGLAFKFGSYE